MDQFNDELMREADEEVQAHKNYRELASRLRAAGHPNEASSIENIALDEKRHADILMTIADAIRLRQINTPLYVAPSLVPDRSIEVLDRISESLIPFYWNIHDRNNGEILEDNVPYSSTLKAVEAAKAVLLEDPRQNAVTVYIHNTPLWQRNSPDEGAIFQTVISPREMNLTRTGSFVPVTYGDWVDLAEKIKAAMPGDNAAIFEVNSHLENLLHGGPLERESKQFLTEKAGQLGIL